VDQIVVANLYGDDVWRAEGRAILSGLTYGEDIDGLDIVVAPQPLLSGKAYYVSVSSGQRGRDGYYGGTTFSVDENGGIGPGRPVRWVDEPQYL